MTYTFDIRKLIDLVKERPVLWNNESNTRAQKNAAWREVCSALIVNYHLENEEEKEKMLKAVRNRWNGIKKENTKYKKKLECITPGSQMKVAEYKWHKYLHFLNQPAHNQTSGSSEEEDNGEENANNEPNTVPSPKKKTVVDFQEQMNKIIQMMNELLHDIAQQGDGSPSTSQNIQVPDSDVVEE